MRASQAFKVAKDFNHGSVDEIISVDDLRGKCDIEWLVRSGTLVPLVAGGVALQSAAPNKAELMGDVGAAQKRIEDLERRLEEVQTECNAAVKLALERGEQIQSIVRESQEAAKASDKVTQSPPQPEPAAPPVVAPTPQPVKKK